jgi:hypothetical protein
MCGSLRDWLGRMDDWKVEDFMGRERRLKIRGDDSIYDRN